jgi:hypothetical protein
MGKNDKNCRKVKHYWKLHVTFWLGIKYVGCTLTMTTTSLSIPLLCVPWLSSQSICRLGLILVGWIIAFDIAEKSQPSSGWLPISSRTVSSSLQSRTWRRLVFGKYTARFISRGRWARRECSSGGGCTVSGSCVMSVWRMHWHRELWRSAANEHYSHTQLQSDYPPPFLSLGGLDIIHCVLSSHRRRLTYRQFGLQFYPEDLIDMVKTYTVRLLGVNGSYTENSTYILNRI